MSTESEAVERPPARVWRRLFLFAGVLTLFVIAFVAMRWAYQRYHTTKGLEGLMARLDAADPGWRLDDIVAALADPPAGQNSAEVVVAVAKLVPGNWPRWNHRFEDLPLPELLDVERSKLLADEMAKMAPALVEARRLAAMPDGKHKLDLGASWWGPQLTDQQGTPRSASLLRYDAWNLARKGNVKGALLAGRACLNAGRSLGDEPFDISQLIRAACVADGLRSVERTLALGEAADADLAEVQKLLRLEGQHPTALVVARGDRAAQHAIFDNIAKGRLSAAEVVEGWSGLGGEPRINFWYGQTFVFWGLDLPRQHFLILKFQGEMAEAAKLPPHEQLVREGAIEARVRTLPGTDILVKWLLAAASRRTSVFRRKLGQIRAMDALLAVERYRLKQGRWPDKLDDIPKEMLPSVPLDPYDGALVRYKRTADGVVAYVLGDNLRDDGGAVERPAADVLPPDLGYRLWDVSKRRRPPPKPADNVAPDPGM